MNIILEILRDAFDTLESQSDSDVDCFESDEEERECVPMQYAARKIMQAMSMLQGGGLQMIEVFYGICYDNDSDFPGLQWVDVRDDGVGCNITERLQIARDVYAKLSTIYPDTNYRIVKLNACAIPHN